MQTTTQISLRPQDVLILLKVAVAENRDWRQMDIAHELSISQAETANALERLRRAGLVDESKRKIFRLATFEFLAHAIKYIYPAQIGSFVRGMPTGHSAGLLKEQIVIDQKQEWVWPDAEGTGRGLALLPIYKTVPFAAKNDPALYLILSLVESIRAGSFRERKIAGTLLKQQLLKQGQEESGYEIES